MKVPKDRVGKDSERLKPVWKITCDYEYNEAMWKTIDTGDNNFQPLVEQILDSQISNNIEGPGKINIYFYATQRNGTSEVLSIFLWRLLIKRVSKEN